VTFSSFPFYTTLIFSSLQALEHLLMANAIICLETTKTSCFEGFGFCCYCLISKMFFSFQCFSRLLFWNWDALLFVMACFTRFLMIRWFYAISGFSKASHSKISGLIFSLSSSTVSKSTSSAASLSPSNWACLLSSSLLWKYSFYDFSWNLLILAFSYSNI